MLFLIARETSKNLGKDIFGSIAVHIIVIEVISKTAASNCYTIPACLSCKYFAEMSSSEGHHYDMKLVFVDRHQKVWYYGQKSEACIL